MNKSTINAIRILSAEAIQKANSGHPGLPLGSAPIAYALFQNHLKFNNADAKWDDRDRFIPLDKQEDDVLTNCNKVADEMKSR